MPFTFVLPWGLASIINLAFHHGLNITILTIAILALEATLVAFGKYPRIIKPKLEGRLSALIFYLTTNAISNIAVFVWFAKDLSV
ncbi:MAG TPA: hypothetical protein VE439_04080 [Anaerolineae bacterium]|nr:hypothetical protein [Anaerolineae bacterium]